MKGIPFHEGWFYKHDGEKGQGRKVTIPHDAMLREQRSRTAPGGANTGWYDGYDYVYEKEFIPDASLEGKNILLEFEGVYRNAEVWIDEKQAAFRPYGYTNFYVDLTDKVKPGCSHRIRVIARNADQPNSRWYSGAGIYRPVTLWVGGRKHIPVNGIRIKTLSVSPAKIQVQVKTSMPGNVKIEVLDGEQTLCACEANSTGKAEVTLDVPDARLWNVDTPNLYVCRVTFGEDIVCEPFGIRTLEWGKNGICINGKRTILLGACVHHDNGLLGACCDEDAVERKVRIMKENGYNALRSAHNPCSKAFLRACDRQGMLVMDEYIDHWYIHKTEYDYVDYFEKWWKQDLKDMVRKDYNHPCVVLYSTGNEVSETAQPKGISLTREMTEYLHGLDHTRPVTCGVNIFFNFLSSIGFGVYSDKKAKKEALQAEKAKKAGKTSRKKAVGSQFFNNLAGLLGDEFMKRGATLHGCDVKTRGAFANMDIAGYNYGIYRYRHDLKKYPDRLILGSETFCKDAYKFYEMAKHNPRLVGDFVWAGMDYLGEVMVGSWEYEDYAGNFNGELGWVSAGSGRVDLTGKPLCEALYTRVAFEKAKGPFIGVCPVNHTGDRHSPSAWKMSNAIESWSFPGYEGRKANVEVYVRAARVELFVNGKKAGSAVLKNDCIAKFSCTYEKGRIEAVAYDTMGKEIGRTALLTADTETVLRAEPEKDAVKPGHLSYVRLRYTDKNGILKPLERGTIHVEVSGGSLEGLGNGCPYNERSYLSDETDTYYGEALAIVRAGDGNSLCVKLSDGLREEKILIPVTKEYLEKSGPAVMEKNGKKGGVWDIGESEGKRCSL
ncbi:glycoside hydrolase family 2 protein [Petralouisia muris]|uniref:Glycoside hydrolase family 2 protein n=1 Tax=Petralouisia muris TaxID=3032872 RepID=A0AC61RYX4_9FIRM|nr:glycoside hydrolase family 2 TIM barrel-domain containing protein [Petralouisia muris]TGY97229.1 glycoside hydrolase family 2 protein [Petralouisia muris]